MEHQAKMSKEHKNSPPHVLIFPLPAQGHVNSMLKLAELLAVAGLRITFLNSDYNHDRLTRHTDVQARLTRYPGFTFRSFSDGLPADHPYRSGDHIEDSFKLFMSSAKEPLKEVVVSCTEQPVRCIIADGIMGFAIDVGDELGIPVIHFRTIAASCFWVYFSIPEMVRAGELPLKGEESESKRDELIKSVSGMETILRRRDLPSPFRVTDLSEPVFQIFKDATQTTARARALILNTFDDLEPSALSLIRTRCPTTYTIGPLHAHLETRLANKTTPYDRSQSQSSGSSLWEVDRSCMTWLDSQPSRSVIYVSFGSIAMVTRDQLLEFWHGLVNSGRRFLWVMRPDSVVGEGGAPAELEEGTRERGYMVGWAPQEEVLAHQSVGGFLTHSGWNSTLESVAAGVPMLCWPYFGDQQVNSRFVGHVWKLGLDMKDVCDRKVVEKMVNDLMVERRDEFVKSADRMAEMAGAAVSEGGSSYSNLDRLIQDIKLWSSETP